MYINLLKVKVAYTDFESGQLITIPVSDLPSPSIKIVEKEWGECASVINMPEEVKNGAYVKYIVSIDMASILFLRTDLIIPYDIKIKKENDEIICYCNRLMDYKELLLTHRDDLYNYYERRS